MLNLQPPYLDVGNLRIYTDDTDPTVFYYITQKPKLCFDENGKPALSVYAVVPESGVGKDNDSILETGLSIDIDLGVTEEELEIAREEVKKNFKRVVKTFSPAPLHKGVVKLFMAQKEGSDNAKNWYVSSGFSPSMVGTNRVSLAIRTTGEDAKRLVAALSNNQIMATISYDLEIIGITPVYKAYMKADMKQVYHHIEEKTKKSFIVYNKEIDKIVEDLQETHALTIEVEEQDPDIKAEAMKSLLNELKTEVVKLFFSENKLLSKQMSLGGVAEALTDFASQTIRTLIPNYSYSKKEIDETQLKTFEINLRQKNAKTFPVSPQGQLKEIIDSAGINIDDYLTWVLLDELEVKGQTVTVRLSANTFEGNFIKSVVTYCRVVDVATGEEIKEPETLAFDGEDIKEMNKLSKDFTYTRYRDKQYRYEYWSHIYLDAVPGVLPSPLVTKVTTTESNYIYINPADYYKNFEIDLNLPDLSVFDQSNLILARVNVYSDDLGGKTVMNKDFTFDKDHADHKSLSIITEREMDLKYKIDFTYVVPNAKDVVLQYEETNESSILLVPNPFENNWEVELDCMADWENVERVIIETRVKDAAQEDPITNIFTFKGDHTTDTLNVACSLDTEKRTFEYYYRVYNRDGSHIEGGWIQVEDESYVAIDVDSLKPERTIQVKLKNPDDFKKNDIGEIKVSFYPTKNAEPMVKSIIKAESVVEFKYSWNKGDDKIYYYKFTAKDKDKSEVFKCKKTADDHDLLLLELVEN